MTPVTELLRAIDAGDSRASAELLPLVYEELRRLAAQKMWEEKPGHTLQVTALVHEAYLRLVGSRDGTPKWNSVGHFFAAAAEAMRRILIESARRKQRLCRGGDCGRVDFDKLEVADSSESDRLLALNEALEVLTKEEPIISELVKLRYFAGLTIEEAATVLEISVRTANRHWAYAKAWLYQKLI